MIYDWHMCCLSVVDYRLPHKSQLKRPRKPFKQADRGRC